MIRLLLLVAAVAAGGALLNAIHSKSEPISVDDAVSATHPTLEAVTSAVDQVTRAADAVATTAQSGMDATNSAMDYINGTAQSVARKLDDMNRPSRPLAGGAVAKPRPGTDQPVHLPPARGNASRIVPLEQAIEGDDARK